VSHGSASSNPAPPAITPAPLLGAAALLALALTGCVPYDAPVSLRLQRLIDTAGEAPDRRGVPLAERDPTPIADATDAFIEREMALADSGASPGAGTPITVDELRVSVIGRNLDLRVAEIAPRLADETLNAERAKFDAVFVADVSYADLDLPTGNSTLLGLSSNDPLLDKASAILTEAEQDREVFKGGAGVVAPLPTGARVGVKQTVEIDDKSGSGLRSSEDRAGTTFSISQPLLRGGGVAVNTASIRLARLGSGVEAAKAKLTLIRVLASAEKAYWRLYAAQKLLQVQREQLGLAIENRDLVVQLVGEGLTPPVERFAADLAVAQQLEGMVVAETAVRLRARDLSRILNRDDLPIGEPAPIRVASDPVLARYRIDPDALVERALAERLELLEVELKLAADAIKIDLAQNATLPVFVVDFEFGLGDRSSTVGSSVANSFEFDNPQWAIGARAAIPITNDAAEARLRRSMLTRLQTTATREQKRLKIRQEVYDAADVLEQNWQRILAARQNVIAAGANYEAEQRLFREGLRTAQDVLVALQQLGKARQKEVKVIAAYQVAQIDLAYATGSLLGYAGTEITPEPTATPDTAPR
jgi:outer membrane protein